MAWDWRYFMKQTQTKSTQYQLPNQPGSQTVLMPDYSITATLDVCDVLVYLFRLNHTYNWYWVNTNHNI